MGQMVQRSMRCEISWKLTTGYLNTLNSLLRSIMAWKAPAQIRTFRFISSFILADGASAAQALGSYLTT